MNTEVRYSSRSLIHTHTHTHTTTTTSLSLSLSHHTHRHTTHTHSNALFACLRTLLRFALLLAGTQAESAASEALSARRLLDGEALAVSFPPALC